MKLMRSALLVITLSVSSLVGCSSSTSGISIPVADMLDSLYFGNGSYADYQQEFLNPSKVISEPEFNKIREGGSKGVFGDSTFSDVAEQLRVYTKDENAAVVYWVDFRLDKSRDLHWNVVKTDNGWKISN